MAKVEKEDFLLKKIRHYQGTIQDFETFWNNKIASSQSEISKETKDCAQHNAQLNKAFDIVPVSHDDDENKPEPLTDKEKKECKCKKGEKCEKGEKCDKKECKCDDKEDKEDKKKKDKD